MFLGGLNFATFLQHSCNIPATFLQHCTCNKKQVALQQDVCCRHRARKQNGNVAMIRQQPCRNSVPRRRLQPAPRLATGGRALLRTGRRVGLGVRLLACCLRGGAWGLAACGLGPLRDRHESAGFWPPGFAMIQYSQKIAHARSCH